MGGPGSKSPLVLWVVLLTLAAGADGLRLRARSGGKVAHTSYSRQRAFPGIQMHQMRFRGRRQRSRDPEAEEPVEFHHHARYTGAPEIQKDGTEGNFAYYKGNYLPTARGGRFASCALQRLSTRDLARPPPSVPFRNHPAIT